MALSVSSLNSNIARVQAMNYPVSNQSQVSSSYKESVQKTSFASFMSAVGATNPVGYANATIRPVDSTRMVEANQKVNADYNTIASGFSGAVIGYGSDQAATSYGMVGSNFDTFA